MWGRGRTPICTTSPFHRFGVKIKTKGETKRDRRISPDEEQRLLAAADKLNCAEHAFAGAPAEHQLAGPTYWWAAINSNFARALGWRPSDHAPFQWSDSSGRTMVKSMYWKDGWIWLEPPRFESLGEGWLVLATPEVIDAIRRLASATQVHLWVERHSHGERPYEGRWHLSKAL